MCELICRICSSSLNNQTKLFEFDENKWTLSETGVMFTSCFHIEVKYNIPIPYYIVINFIYFSI